MSQTAYRTHHATEVTEALVGQKVTLAAVSYTHLTLPTN